MSYQEKCLSWNYLFTCGLCYFLGMRLHYSSTVSRFEDWELKGQNHSLDGSARLLVRKETANGYSNRSRRQLRSKMVSVQEKLLSWERFGNHQPILPSTSYFKNLPPRLEIIVHKKSIPLTSFWETDTYFVHYIYKLFSISNSWRTWTK